ncbi:MAG: heme lyase CcmF/NrfE family subunit [Actinobacteria bacterium]|nr:heme lyase CcmF/NrfE family subunit [Actinomycetota bacterium]
MARIHLHLGHHADQARRGVLPAGGPARGAGVNALVGYAGSLTAATGAVALALSGTLAATGSARARRWARTSAVAMVFGAGVAMLAMVVALLTDDFSVRYVAEHHSRATPFPFDVATAWAALEGSILLWVLVLAGFTAAVARTVGDDDRLGYAALAVLGVVAVFFTVLVASVANPFGAVAPVPTDGPGPNPLLQNHLLMAIHPPLLYLGYVGLTVPFAFAIAALATGDARTDWLDRTRRWTLIAWTSLTAGIAVGGLWSYEVLGWGGFWAWDPVENASFLPWLTATAFLHSAIAQARRGVLRAWNVTLVIATFALTILGTFLTRSGVVASVHSFTQSDVGPALLGFLVVVLVGSLGLFAARAHVVTRAPRIDRLVSREGAFLVNNLLLTVFAFVVLLGTTYPIVLEALTTEQTSVGRPFFDRFATPIGMALLAAVAAGPLLPYRAARPGLLWQRLELPVLAGLAAGAAVVVAGVVVPSVILAVVLGTVVVGAILADALRATEDLSAPRPRAFLRLVHRNRGWWGGQLSHLGLAVTAVAIAVTAGLGQETTTTLELGGSTSFPPYVLRYDGMVEREEERRIVRAAQVTVLRDGREIETLEPSLNLYRNSSQPVATPSVRTTLSEDLYLALRRLDPDRVSLEVYRYPFMWLLWFGCAVVVAGGAWSLSRGPRRPGRRISAITPSERPDEEVLVDA